MERQSERKQRPRETDWSLNSIDAIALALLIVGAINWGLVGLFNFNFITLLFGGSTILERVIYIIVGIAGVWSIIELSIHLHQHAFRRARHAAAHH
jgi:uncharacterized membrane protein YuzA (DUF378 family)